MSQNKTNLVGRRRVWIASLVMSVAAAAQGAQTCIPITQRLEDKPKNPSYVQDQHLRQPGRYCLQEDIFVKGHTSWAEGGRIFNVSQIIVNIRASDVLLDLNGHAAWSDGRLDAGIESAHADDEKPLPNPPKNITIRNGAVRLEHQGIGIRISGLGGLASDSIPEIVASDAGARMLSDEKGPVFLGKALPSPRESTELEHADLMKSLPKGPAAYPARGIRIEKMSISTQQAAVVTQGAGTVIRDSVIEAQSGTAIWIYGPGAVIENNTIIVHGRAPTLDPLLEADAPIRLIHADGAVVRNNRIVAIDGSHRRGLALFETANISVEGNRFEGFGATDEWAKVFTGAATRIDAKDNRFEPERVWWKKLIR